MRLYLSIFISIIFLHCQSENHDNSRAYVEGKIIEAALPLNKIIVTMMSNDAAVGETAADNSGNFTVSGPQISDSFSLHFNAKIQSFKASTSGTTVSADSLQILVPAATTYITFTDIKLK